MAELDIPPPTIVAGSPKTSPRQEACKKFLKRNSLAKTLMRFQLKMMENNVFQMVIISLTPSHWTFFYWCFSEALAVLQKVRAIY